MALGRWHRHIRTRSATPGCAGRRRSPDGPPDAELLQRHLAGDQDAFGALFLRHKDRMWAVALRIVCDPDDAADALQDAMISAFRRAGDFRGDSADHHLDAPDRRQRLT